MQGPAGKQLPKPAQNPKYMDRARHDSSNHFSFPQRVSPRRGSTSLAQLQEGTLNQIAPLTELYKPGAFDLPQWQFGSLPPAQNIHFPTFKCVSEQTLQANTSSRPRKDGAVDSLQPQGEDGDPWTCWVGLAKAWA